MKKLKFAEKRDDNETVTTQNPWKILIADDEEEVHVITKAVLAEFNFENRGLLFLSAYSGIEAQQIIQDADDIALIFLDVVMESEHAGLETAKWIRDVYKNRDVRIALRTGQPGNAPEQSVIRDYDINDYKEKTELTTNKLFTTVVSSLRSYRDIMTIKKNRDGLESIIKASSDIFKIDSFEGFVQGVMHQLMSLIELKNGDGHKSAFSVLKNSDGYQILGKSGVFEDQHEHELISDDIEVMFDEALENKTHITRDNNMVYFFETESGTASLFYFIGCS
jgi:CheY-like chemotaxis protein